MGKGKRFTKVLVIILCLLVIVVGATIIWAYNLLNKVQHVPLVDEGKTKSDVKPVVLTPKDLGVKEDAPKPKVTGVVNVLLFGLDGREEGQKSRSDSIMIATLDGKHKNIKLTSLMRDMYVPIPEREDNRINAAYAFGGPALAIRTVNEDFDMNIEKYVTVDFFSLEKVIDKLGGVEIEIKDYEINHLNGLIQGLNGLNKNENKAALIESPGVHRLNGRQAVAYSRIRKVGNADYERTDRQRRVLEALIKEMTSIEVWELPSVLSTILPEVETNFTANELMKLGYTGLECANNGVKQLRLPYNDTYTSERIRGMSVLVPDLEKNKEILHKFIYEND
ncbi:LCP family protein [Xylanivirga thermophila]|uniref:LCP family protein n=1 Tax=Xylanivirga thermophila TaxID=2496273 RepID=UPI00101C6396|nr:LCP family protein [Xylanivirga thermophila]